MFYKCKKRLFYVVIIAVVAGLFSFRSDGASDRFQWIEACFKRHFDAGADGGGLKKCELSVNNKGFFRLKKHYASGKQEYFSFNLGRLVDFNYWGSEDHGAMVFKTKSDDIIVQTYNDPKGNIDSMASCLKMQAIHIKPEILDSLWLKLHLRNVE